MIGLGITQPVLPFYVERLALGGGASRQAVAINIGLITGVFALGQLLFAPFVLLSFCPHCGAKPQRRTWKIACAPSTLQWLMVRPIP